MTDDHARDGVPDDVPGAAPDDEGFELLPGRPEFIDAVFDTFGEERVELETLGGGAVRLIGFERGDAMSVVTVGLHRVPLSKGEAVELVCDAPKDAVGAALVTLGIAVERLVHSRRAPESRRPWINEVPYLEGTKISAMVVDERDVATVRDAAGALLGRLRRVVLLTNVEARFVAEHGLDALPGGPDALRDVERDDLVGTKELQVPDVPCLVSSLLDDRPARWIEVDLEGRFVALSLDEDEEFLDEIDNFAIWSVRTLIEKNPSLREFVLTAVPGDCARLTDDGWLSGRQAGFVGTEELLEDEVSQPSDG